MAKCYLEGGAPVMNFEFDVSDAFDGLWEEVQITSYPEGYYEPTTGKFVSGDPVSSTEKGVILPLSTEDLVHEGGGTATEDSQKLYIYIKLKQGQKLTRVEANEVFEIREQKNFSRASGLYVYIIRRTGVAGK